MAAETVRVGTTDVKLTAPYQGPGLPPELCPFRHQTRDHRGLDPWEAVLWQRALSRLSNKTLWGASVEKALRSGQIPFATCKNPLDGGRRWGRYYDEATGVVTTRPVPPKKCGKYDVVCKAKEVVDDVKEWVVATLKSFYELGEELLKRFADIVADAKVLLDLVVDFFKMGICAMVDDEWKRALLKAGAIFAGLPPAGTELAIKLVRALCALLRIIEIEVSGWVKGIAAAVTVTEIMLK
ncbi:MAG: hypothetical protein JSV86_10680 [Gemmatimonadota bacterium]|nr:MAG: hypothetical protein JSV86_10680 [Gemmatimonadota bacterium]